MALAIVGTPLGARRIDYPHDPADFNRCLKFVAAVPEARQHFYTIAKLSKEWAAIIQHWDRIEAQFLDEVGYDWCRRREAPKTYALMRKVLDGAA
ncbi:MAG: hypothetical protein HY749_16010 [Gammaproteobacteria bacterium]|nr:hypothetical protein [Gammaproteobacteria bacterium]